MFPTLRRSLRILKKKKSKKSVILLKSIAEIEPLDDNVVSPTGATLKCKFKYRGCKRRFQIVEAYNNHIKECKYRWYQCEGKLFLNWTCSFKGYFEDVHYHYKTIHPERTYMSAENQIDTKIRFEKESASLELIRKNKQLFWYKHRVLVEEKVAFWMCQYVGPEDEATRYCYEITISHGVRQLSITELCHSDAWAPDELYKTEKCAILTFRQIAGYFNASEQLRIRFRIKKISVRK